MSHCLLSHSLLLSVPRPDQVWCQDQLQNRKMSPNQWTVLAVSGAPDRYFSLLISGTFFILYDFIEYFKKDNPSFLPRKAFLEIIDSIFGSQWPVSQLEKDAIIFQVIIIIINHYCHNPTQLNPKLCRPYFPMINQTKPQNRTEPNRPSLFLSS